LAERTQFRLQRTIAHDNQAMMGQSRQRCDRQRLVLHGYQIPDSA
jgi:hypothetical protein